MGRVAITGSGAICALGDHVERIWKQIRKGSSGIRPIRQWDTAHWKKCMAGEIADLDPSVLLQDRKLLKSIRRTDVLGLSAAAQAIEMARLEQRPDRNGTNLDEQTGVFVGSGGSGYQDQYDFFPLMTRADGEMSIFGRELLRTVHPMWLLRSLPNNVLCHLGIRYGFKGPNSCITQHGASGLLALAEAANVLRDDEAKRAVVVGHEAPIEPEKVQHFDQLGLLTADAVRPFDEARSGCVLGEAAAAFVLEEMTEARDQGATVLGEILGSACVTEGEGLFHVRPDGDGMARAIRLALADAAVTADEVGMIVAHGNGTRNSDASEAAALLRVFGAKAPPITAFKWSFGHPLAAAGILDAVLAVAALQDEVVPGVATLRSLDPECRHLPISAEEQRPRSDVALVLSRGFAGTNVALLLRRSAPA